MYARESRQEISRQWQKTRGCRLPQYISVSDNNNYKLVRNQRFNVPLFADFNFNVDRVDAQISKGT